MNILQNEIKKQSKYPYGRPKPKPKKNQLVEYKPYNAHAGKTICCGSRQNDDRNIQIKKKYVELIKTNSQAVVLNQLADEYDLAYYTVSDIVSRTKLPA